MKTRGFSSKKIAIRVYLTLHESAEPLFHTHRCCTSTGAKYYFALHGKKWVYTMHICRNQGSTRTFFSFCGCRNEAKNKFLRQRK